MSKRSLAVMASVLAALAAISGLLWIFSRPGKKAGLASASLPPRIVRLEIDGPGGSFKFSKSGPDWKMQFPVSYPADPAAFQKSVDRLADVRLSGELSRDPAHYGLFGLDPSSATHVRAYADMSAAAPDLDFYVGKEGPEYETFYMRRASGPEVMEADGVSSRDFTKSAGDWLDKTIVAISSGDVVELGIRSAKGPVRIKRERGKWVLSSGQTLSTSTVTETLQPMLERLVRMEADGVAISSGTVPAGKAGSAVSEMTIDVRFGTPARSVTLKIGGKDDRGYRAVERSGESRVRFLVMDWKFDSFRKRF